MATTDKKVITVTATINAPVHDVWNLWTDPAHIVHWNQASPEWHCPKAVTDLQEGGRFNYRMEAKDGSMGFNFSGTFTQVDNAKELSFTIDDGRRVQVLFGAHDHQTTVTEIFEADENHSSEIQQEGWQSILAHFKAYAEKPDTFPARHF